MSAVHAFDLLSVPLEGVYLTEASAGTGKTYTITGLFLRLILEKGLSVDQILVVTFTEAATEELKERIRRKLREAIHALSAGGSKDPFLDGLVKRQTSSEKALRHLREAVRAFDQAAISTIHGFCRRVLYQNAFESGSLFDTKLVQDQQSLEEEIVEDFWRYHLYGVTSLFARHVMNRGLSPSALLSLFDRRVVQPQVQVVPRAEMVDSAVQEQMFVAGLDRVRGAWRRDRKEVLRVLLTDKGLHRGRYQQAGIPAWAEAMDHLTTPGGEDPELFPAFTKFTTREIRGATKKGFAAPEHPFFDLCEELAERGETLLECFEKRLLGLRSHLFRSLPKELAGRKKEKNLQSFDDLLIKLQQALEGRGGEALGRAIRGQYKAAMIDEFQDTDPVQYAIFNKAFGMEDHVLFLIGDPKQAIYSFRGADVFSYMEGAKRAEGRYTLSENWRSEPALVQAVNTVFSRVSDPFIYGDIPFHPCRAAEDTGGPTLRIQGEGTPPFHLWFVGAKPVTGKDAFIPRKAVTEKICDAVSGEIVRLVTLGRRRQALLGENPIEEGDIAVLVRKNREARLIQKALARLQVSSVLYSGENLFDSLEAPEVSRVLAAVLEPNDESRVRAALATDMMGFGGEELEALAKDESGWEARIVQFKGYHDIWLRKGFVQMFRLLLDREDILARLMSLEGGERRCTNVLHLCEVLHQASKENKLGMGELLKWLREQRDPLTPRLEEHQLRLERDERAVKIITIHRSKGLEFPIVFCPFAWDGSRLNKGEKPFLFHDDRHNMRPTVDIGSDDQAHHRFLAEKEQLSENLRLLYVALTRAKNRCYLVWGRFKGADTSAPAYLFHRPSTWDGLDVLTATSERFRSLDDDDLFRELESVAAGSDGTICLRPLPEGTKARLSQAGGEPEALSCRVFGGTIDRSWKMSSYSSLIASEVHQTDRTVGDREAADTEDEYQPLQGALSAGEGTDRDIFSFPRGTRAGTFVHDVFEHVRFSEKDATHVETLVMEKLAAYGLEPHWQGPICTMVRKVLSVPFDADQPDLTLSSVSEKDRLNELGFYFPLQTVSSETLKEVFDQCRDLTIPESLHTGIDRLHFSPVKGFLRGFIDLVFQSGGRYYLVDWKSNFLGDRIEDYGQEALAATMSEAFYGFQSLLYTIALDRYLHLRLPGYRYERHFGGAYYLFVRGIDPDRGPDYGVFRNYPPSSLVTRLCRRLIDGKNG